MESIPSLSVIVPTYNRLKVLLKCLRSLEAQTVAPDNWEVVIVDDGSTDGTAEQIAVLLDESCLNVHFSRQDHKGPAAARNLGVREALGDLILFIGDDIIATPNLLAGHISWHEKYPARNVAVLGYVTWSPEIEVTPFMHWLENGGPQFSYYELQDKSGQNVHYKYFYSCNVSLKKRFLLKNGLFDEEFPLAAYEDTELGYRLVKKGLRIVYNSDAVGYHYHLTSLDDTLHRMERIGELRPLYLSKVGVLLPEYWDTPCTYPVRRIISIVKFELVKTAGRFCETRWNVPWLYMYLMEKAKWEGIAKAMRCRPKT